MDQKRIQVGNSFAGKHFMKKYYNITLFHSNSYIPILFTGKYFMKKY